MFVILLFQAFVAQGQEKFGLKDVGRLMHAVNQGPATLQTMVFEPKGRRLHLAIGPGPASAQPLKTLQLAPLFQRKALPGR